MVRQRSRPFLDPGFVLAVAAYPRGNFRSRPYRAVSWYAFQVAGVSGEGGHRFASFVEVEEKQRTARSRWRATVRSRWRATV